MRPALAAAAAAVLLGGCTQVTDEPDDTAVSPTVATPFGDRIAFPDGLWITVAPPTKYDPAPDLVHQLGAPADSVGLVLTITAGNDTDEVWSTGTVAVSARVDDTPTPFACDVRADLPCAFAEPLVPRDSESARWGVLVPPDATQLAVDVQPDPDRPAHTWSGPVNR